MTTKPSSCSQSGRPDPSNQTGKLPQKTLVLRIGRASVATRQLVAGSAGLRRKLGSESIKTQFSKTYFSQMYFPMRCMPITYIPRNEVHAHEMHACEVHVYEVHAHETPAYEVYA